MLDLTGKLPETAPPNGIELFTVAERPDLVGEVYEVYREGAVDIPGEEDSEILSFDDWLTQDMSSPSDSPEWTFFAVTDAQVVGYAKFSLTEAQPHTAHHDLTAVKRAWRGRGTRVCSRACSCIGLGTMATRVQSRETRSETCPSDG